MSKGTQTGACAPSMANQMPRLRASFAMSAAGKSWPVVHVTWLTRIRRVRGLIRPAMRSTLPCARSRSGSKRRMTMPSRCIRLRSPTLTATCSCVDVITSSPFFRGRPLMIALMPSVAQPMSARSSLRQAGPSRRARRSLTLHQSVSSWPALGARSSAAGPLPQGVEHRHRAGAEAAEVQVRPAGVQDEFVADELPESRVAIPGRGLQRGPEVSRSRGPGNGQAAHHRRHALEEFLAVHLPTFGSETASSPACGGLTRGVNGRRSRSR